MTIAFEQPTVRRIAVRPVDVDNGKGGTCPMWRLGILIRGDGGFAHHLAVIVIGVVLWWLNPDPLPDAIERGLDAYRRKHQR